MKLHRLGRLLAVATALVFAPAAPAAVPAALTAPEPFREGDRWVAIGDSITHGGSYHRWIELFYRTRFPNRALEVSNAGLSGDTAAGAVRRYAWDIAPARATVATIMLGMNDVGRQFYAPDQQGPEIELKRRERIDDHVWAMRTLLQLLRRDGARIVIIRPSIFDQTAVLEKPNLPGANDAIAEANRRVLSLAPEFGATVVNFQSPMLRVNAERQRHDPAFTVVSADRVHPTPAGHFFMAALFLRAQAVDPEVATVIIDGAAVQLGAARNCAVKELMRYGDGLSFRYLASALPFPVDPSTRPALAWFPFQEELNRELLQVTGLSPGDYQLEIDGQDIRRFDARELARGVNLALETNTPQARQAAEVARLAKARWDIVHGKIRTIALVEHQMAPPHTGALKLGAMESVLEQRLREVAGTVAEAGTRKNVDAYRLIKPQEDALQAEAVRLAAELRVAAQPQSRFVRIRRAATVAPAEANDL